MQRDALVFVLQKHLVNKIKVVLVLLDNTKLYVKCFKQSKLKWFLICITL